MQGSRKYAWTAVVCLLAMFVIAGRSARADVVYLAATLENNYVPFGEDGTPNRPVPGDQLGNTITLDGTARNLTRITMNIALNNSAGAPAPADDTWTADIYLNDGPPDPSGLLQPSTLIGTTNIEVIMPPDSVTVVFDFTGQGVVLPDSFTVVVHSSHPTDQFFGSQGVAGPFSNAAPPTIGSGSNTMWYTDTNNVWITNATWAIDDGATTNFFTMQIEADN